MSPVVSVPRQDVHECSPSWTEQWGDGPAGPAMYLVGRNRWAQDGTVWACENCGKTWVAHHPRWGVLVASWRPEGRWERWRRERGER